MSYIFTVVVLKIWIQTNNTYVLCISLTLLAQFPLQQDWAGRYLFVLNKQLTLLTQYSVVWQLSCLPFKIYATNLVY